MDLSDLDNDFATATPPANSEVPDGKYVVAVEQAQLATAKTSGNRMLKWHLRIVEGEHTGRMLFRNNVLATRENMAWLKKDLETCQLKLEKLSELEPNLEKLLDLKLEVVKKSKGENANVYLNKYLGKVTAEEKAEVEAKGNATPVDSDIPF